MTTSKILALDTGLFGEAETIHKAVAQVAGSRTIAVAPAGMSSDDWDTLLSDIMAADKIITI